MQNTSSSCEDTPSGITSPLMRISAALNNGNRYFGYPLKVVDNEFVSNQCKSSTCLVIVLMFCMGGPVAFTIAIGLMYIDIPWKVVSEIGGQSTLDMLLVAACITLSFVASIFIVWTSRRKVRALNEIFGQLDAMEIMSLGLESHCQVKTLARRLKYSLAVFLVPFFAQTFWLYYKVFFKDHGFAHIGLYIVFVSNLIGPLYGFLNPLLFTTSYLLIYMYGCISECYMELEKLIRSLPGNRKHSLKISKFAQSLEELLKNVNNSFEMDVFVSCGIYLVYLSLYTYSATSAFLDSDTLYKILSGMVSGVLDFMFISTIFKIYQTGQNVEDSIKKAAVALENYILDENSEDSMVKARLQSVLKRLERPNPISPCSAFALNNSGLLSVITVSLTYLIVLIQFKVA